MFAVEPDGSLESKETHLENLHTMVQYCENKSDCRRAIQLQYFGENYRKRCPNNPAVACDNCLSQVLIRSEVFLTLPGLNEFRSMGGFFFSATFSLLGKIKMF